MPSCLTTTYLGHKIEIEPFEWGYVARVGEPGSDRRLTAANISAFQALEEAFAIVEQTMKPPEERRRAPPPRAASADLPASDPASARAF